MKRHRMFSKLGIDPLTWSIMYNEENIEKEKRSEAFTLCKNNIRTLKPIHETLNEEQFI